MYNGTNVMVRKKVHEYGRILIGYGKMEGGYYPQS